MSDPHPAPAATLILASTSPRRQQLLALADIPFTTLAVDIDETAHAGESPTAYIQRMVAAKADQAITQLFSGKTVSQTDAKKTDANNCQPLPQHQPSTIILSADTIGVLADGVSILGKPQNKADAYAMWTQMSDSTHTVWTAVQLSVVNAAGERVHKQSLLEKTAVTFVRLSEPDMAAYWHSGEPQDKAGAYAIQGKGALWVKTIAGSYTNVVGLPLCQTVAAIKALLD